MTHMNKEYKGVICRGSISLGTGCYSCEKCVDELKKLTQENGLPRLDNIPPMPPCKPPKRDAEEILQAFVEYAENTMKYADVGSYKEVMKQMDDLRNDILWLIQYHDGDRRLYTYSTFLEIKNKYIRRPKL